IGSSINTCSRSITRASSRSNAVTPHPYPTPMGSDAVSSNSIQNLFKSWFILRNMPPLARVSQNDLADGLGDIFDHIFRGRRPICRLRYREFDGANDGFRI